MDEIQRMMQRNWGVCRFSHLRRLGLDRFQIRDLVDHGLLLKTARGTYALPSARPDIVKAAGQNVSLACVSAASARGLWVWKSPAKPHVVKDSAKEVPGCVVHRGKRSARQLVVSDFDAVCQAFRCVPGWQALVVAEGAVAGGRVMLRDLLSHFAGSHDWRIRLLIGRIRTDSQSMPETLARLALEDAGFHVDTQVQIAGVGRVDGVVNGGLVYEIDGRKFHSGPKEFENDRSRWNSLVMQGIPVVRIPARWVLRDPNSVLPIVSGALSAMKSASSVPVLVRKGIAGAGRVDIQHRGNSEWDNWEGDAAIGW
ncbi:type IV toxin-antitoxin system AbiEi family antitoxin domain-containing protein [Arthrobacter sp. NPDC080031]|uniref:type IV toxin-antitoxin system AbiEi family antitoxin domain-containing protein n=1 Tax=Arthrobacter sp. NPDC080031 TaxID=3155918 RepID=UPI00344C1BA7